MIDFSISELGKYWDVLKHYINPFAIIYWAIVGAILGFVLVLVIQLLLRKTILINRRHWSLKVLAYIYMAFFPLWASFSCLQWCAIHGCEKEIVKNVPLYLGETNSLFNKYMKDEVMKVISEKHLQLTGHEIVDKSIDYAGDKIPNYLAAKLIESGAVKKIIVDKIESSIGKPLLMDKKLTKELLDTKVQDLLDEGFINTVAIKHVKKISGGLKMNVFLIFLLVMAIPIAEIILAHYLEKKRLPPLPPAVF